MRLVGFHAKHDTSEAVAVMWFWWSAIGARIAWLWQKGWLAGYPEQSNEARQIDLVVAFPFVAS